MDKLYKTITRVGGTYTLLSGYTVAQHSLHLCNNGWTRSLLSTVSTQGYLQNVQLHLFTIVIVPGATDFFKSGDILGLDKKSEHLHNF